MTGMPLPVETGESAGEPRRRSLARAAAIGAVVVAVLGAGGGYALHVVRDRRAAAAALVAHPPAGPDLTSDSLARAPLGVRIKVRVVNATRVRGLARRATQAIRDRGYDVVEVATTGQQLDTTVVLDRSGHADWARRLARAMGGARVESRPDSSHYLDLTVLVGRAWHAPAEPFYP
ncbi:MAG TPA: LytR C-terminal domain-containing protein [Gemmatirosa sp.]